MSERRKSKKDWDRRHSVDVSEIGEPRQSPHEDSPPLTEEQLRIGEDLRNECRDDLETFNVKVFPNSTGLKPFGKVQRDSIAQDYAVIKYGGRICKAEPRAYGKALALDTPIPTPGGWTTMGDLAAGDFVFDGNGKPTEVTFATEVQLGRQCYEVAFSDGETIVADADHQWLARDRFYRKGSTAKVYRTSDMVGREILTTRRGIIEKRYSIDLAPAIECDPVPVTIDPYVLGCWIGDGNTSGSVLTCHKDDQPHFSHQMESCGESLNLRATRQNPKVITATIGIGSKMSMDSYGRKLRALELIENGHSTKQVAEKTGMCRPDVSRLRKHVPERPCLNVRLSELGLRGNKHIPSDYLRGSVQQRLALLQGIMDTDGDISKSGVLCSVTTVLPWLHSQYCELLSSLGFKHGTDIHNGSYRIAFTAYRDFPVFRIARKFSRLRGRPEKRTPSQSKRIVSIKPHSSVAVRCIQVASNESTFLAGRRMTVTHNTSRTCNAALFAVLYQLREMVPVFSANTEKSKSQIMARWKAEIMSNDLLYWMFPYLIWPLRCLENRHQRCAGQTYNGELTCTQWTSDRIVFPTIEGVPGSGSAMIGLPLPSCRGATHTKPDGTILRPDLVILDDVQKDEDAHNPRTVTKLEELIAHSAMMLGGHSKTMSAIMNCTVRETDDLSDRHLKKPGWRRVRYKMLESRATHEKKHWLGPYAELRMDYNPEDPKDQTRARKKALQYFKDNMEEMKEGAVATWEWAYTWGDEDPTEISALQHAYNIIIDDGEEVFASECQNEPLQDVSGLPMLKGEEICKKQSHCLHNQVPQECTKLTSFVDVHPEILYWHVWAWEENFTGYLIDYGTFPKQPRRNFRHDNCPRPLSKLFPGLDDYARANYALKGLIEGWEPEGWKGLCTREWTKTDGVPVKIDRLHIDANGEAKDSVKKYIRRSPFTSMLCPSFGAGIGAKHRPLSSMPGGKEEWIPTKPKPGEPTGIRFDTNFWKTRFHRALALPEGSQGALYVYKTTKPDHHRRLAEHWTAEPVHEVMAYGRIVYEFGEPRPGRENHDFDCAVGAMVAANCAGITSVKKVSTRRRMSMRQYQEETRRKRRTA